MTVRTFKADAIRELSHTSPSPELDAEVLLLFSLNITRTELLLEREREIPQENLAWLNSAIKRRAQGLPVAYITGHKEFYGYDFLVTPDVLIPKPDTEILVEKATKTIFKRIDDTDAVCDMCTGSGCIALSVMKTLLEDFHVPEEQLPDFTLADISEAALDVARKNAELLFGKSSPLVKSRLSFVRTNLFASVPACFDVILTNPPYVPAAMTEELLKDGRSEPRLALDGDVTPSGEKSGSSDGLEVIRNLLPQAKTRLKAGGIIFMETGEYNAKKAGAFAESLGFKCKVHKDLEGQLRVTELSLG